MLMESTNPIIVRPERVTKLCNSEKVHCDDYADQKNKESDELQPSLH